MFFKIIKCLIEGYRTYEGIASFSKYEKCKIMAESYVQKSKSLKYRTNMVQRSSTARIYNCIDSVQ